MGKLAIISDLHVDINHFGEPELALLFSVLQEAQVTRLHFAGDTANKIDEALAVNDFFRQRGLPTTFNLGNHEMGSIQGEEMIEHFPDSHFLNLRYLPLNSQTVLLGVNGWYDYSFSDSQDLKKNATTKKAYWYDRIIERSGDDVTVNQRILTQLEGVLADLSRYQVILATHFVPQEDFIVHLSGKYQLWNRLNAFLGSASLGKLLDRSENVSQVVFGHTHRRFEDRIIAGTRYSCRPLGYYYEWQLTREFVLNNQLIEEYVPMKLRSVLRDNQRAFNTYKAVHLAEEFRQSMTLITYE
ncbi:phosphohydrolase [Enterococcus florum]|uniref:Phosphohydrolase n=1 Tax=Enterococcus florum TaxID=2480627 RepID=A0A4P5PC87_9ENTE|nr:metallophosphoesterase [Enterococcus florum]GCF93901.1 phosphohydrolase [Enterococcus florum]